MENTNSCVSDERFAGMKPFESRVWLSSPTMHGLEQEYVNEAISTNWVSTVGNNINEIEKLVAEKVGRSYSIALSSGTSALHLAIRRCGEKLYGMPKEGYGVLNGHKVFCTDMTFAASVNPIIYEGGEPVFIDTEYDTWNMDPLALEKAFEIYPEVRLVVLVHLYGVPAKIEEIRLICERHGAIIVEDAAESFGATYRGIQTGNFGIESVISFNGNKIITGSSGGMLLTDNIEDADKIRKWSTQSRENVPWYEHREIGYNYRMSNIIAGIVRGQLPYLENHISKKKEIYERYKDGLKALPVSMNPYDKENSEPNYWLSCLLIDKEAMKLENSGDNKCGKTNPKEILEVLSSFNAEGRNIWKPMHLQPIYKFNSFITKDSSDKEIIDKVGYQKNIDVGKDIFERGLCLPSDSKMTVEQQDIVIELIKRCF